MPTDSEDDFDSFESPSPPVTTSAKAVANPMRKPPPRAASGGASSAARASSAAAASAAAAAATADDAPALPASPAPVGSPPAAPELRLCVCGWPTLALLALAFCALGAVAYANPSLQWAGASGPGGGASGAASKSLFFSDPSQVFAAGALSASGTPSPGPPSASRTPTGTPTPTSTQSAGASASASPTPSGTGTGSASGTPTGSGTGTPSASPTGTPTPSNTATRGGGGRTPAQCLARTTQWANATFVNGCDYDVCCYALTLEMAHHAPYAACSAREADAQRTAYAASLAPADMCYLVMGSAPGSAAAVRSTWGLLLAGAPVWYAVPAESVQPGDAAAYPNLLPITGGEGRGAVYSKQNMHALKLVLADPRAAACKWLMVASDHTWVNPRAALSAVRGLPHDGMPMQLGYIWAFMGFVSFVTGSSGGVALWNRAALDILARVLLDPEQCPLSEGSWVRGPPFDKTASLIHPTNDLVALHACAIRNGITAVNLNQMDASGALALNGVPLEPGPAGPIMAWLQADYNRAGHWVSVDNIGDGLINAFFAAFKNLYGPLGQLGAYGSELAASAPGSRAPAGEAAWTADYYLPPPSYEGHGSTFKGSACAAPALAALQALVAAGRDGAVSGLPLPLELAAEAQAAACPGDTPHVTAEDICLLVSKDKPTQRSVTIMVVKDAWGWRVAERLFVFGDAVDEELGVRTLPGGPYGPDKRSVPMLRALYGAPETAGCKWWGFVHDYDSVNPRAMAAMLRGLRWDVPVIAGFWWYNSVTGPLTTLAKGRGLYSRAAVQILAERLSTPLCPPGAGGATAGIDDSADLAVCAWRSGIVPLHTFLLDVAGFGIMNDWAFQQEHYLMGWGLLIDQGINPFDSSDNAFPFKMALLEQYYNKLYARRWNVSVPEYYDIGNAPYPGMPSQRLLRGGRPADASSSSSSSKEEEEWRSALAARRLSPHPPEWLMGWE